MSKCSHFHLLDSTKVFPNNLLKDIEEVIELYSNLVHRYYLEEDVIAVTFKENRFETLFLTTDYEKTPFKIKFPDNSLYSGFKYQSGKTNVLASTIMLLIKYHLKEAVTISSDDFEYCISSDWSNALTYLKDSKSYDINLEYHENYPKVYINNEWILNIYDGDGSIFSSMFKVVTS